MLVHALGNFAMKLCPAFCDFSGVLSQRLFFLCVVLPLTSFNNVICKEMQKKL